MSLPDPVTRGEVFLNSIARGTSNDLPSPVTREEIYLNAIAKGITTGLPSPVTREEVYLESIAKNGGGGGGGGIDPSDATATAGDILASKTAYIADGSKATGTIQSKSAATYYPSASDQTIASGQYLSGAQTIKAVTYDGLSAGNIKKDVVVKIGDASDDDRIVSVTGTYEGGGGSSPWTKLAEQDFTVSTTSTSATQVGVFELGSAAWTSAKMVYVRVRDKAGPRNGYFYGSDVIFINTYAANGSSSNLNNAPGGSLRKAANGNWAMTAITGSGNGYGVYGATIASGGDVKIESRYSSGSSLTVDGTFHVEVYTLEWPDNVSPFA